MANRRPLTDGLATPVTADLERQFVYQEKTAPTAQPPITIQTVSRVPLSTRIRSDFASALKRASLERQLAGTSPNTLQDILEEALEPWLRSNGYLQTATDEEAPRS